MRAARGVDEVQHINTRQKKEKTRSGVDRAPGRVFQLHYCGDDIFAAAAGQQR